MEISILHEHDQFRSFLIRKGLSLETQKLYLLYLEKMVFVLNEADQNINQDIIDLFIDIYPHAVNRAFLKNYLEYKKIKDLEIIRKSGRPPKKETITLSSDELSKIRDRLYSHDDKYGLLFDLSVACALRRQEVINLRCRDIKINDNDIMSILVKGKGNKERVVIVPKEIATLVITYTFSNDLKPHDYLFKSTTDPSRPMDKTMWNKAFSHASVDAIGKKYHPHQLRHTRATAWFEKGIDIVRIQQRLGHSNIATTRLYLNPDNKKELEKWSKEDQ